MVQNKENHVQRPVSFGQKLVRSGVIAGLALGHLPSLEQHPVSAEPVLPVGQRVDGVMPSLNQTTNSDCPPDRFIGLNKVTKSNVLGTDTQAAFNIQTIDIKAGVISRKPLVSQGLRKTQFDDKATTLEGLERIRTDGSVSPGKVITLFEAAGVEIAQDCFVHADEVSPDGFTMPNDPVYFYQWNLNKIEYIQAQGFITSSSSVTPTVYFLDTGLDATQPEFQGTKILPGVNFTNPDDGQVNTDTSDKYGHGTKVASVVIAKSNNNESIAGIQSQVEVEPLKVLGDNGKGFMSSVIEAVIYAGEKSKASGKTQLVNISMGGYGNVPFLQDALRTYSQTLLYIASAGNEGRDATKTFPVWVPAAYPEAIAVGSSSKQDTRSSFSNFGIAKMLYAPGEDIPVIFIDGNPYLNKGTSLSAPHLTGVAIELLRLNPNLKPEDIRKLLTDGAEDMSDGSGKRINMARSLLKVQGKELPGETRTIFIAAAAISKSGGW